MSIQVLRQFASRFRLIRRGQALPRKRNTSRHQLIAEQLESRRLLATYVVSNLNDSGSGSLRVAIHQANLNAGLDTINFRAEVNGTIALSSTLQITDSVNINGTGVSRIIVSGGNQNFGVININNSNSSLIDVAIRRLTIRDGGNGTDFINGAGIASFENLSLDRVAILSNSSGATAGGGGIQVFAGSLKMIDSTVANNSARQGGGIELSTDAIEAIIVNSTISGNEATGFGGGVIATSGNIVLRNSTITGNRANSDGVSNEIGGGVFGNVNGTLESITLYNTIVAGNTRGATQTPNDIGNPVRSISSNNVIGNSASRGGLTNGVNGNIIGNNGTGTRPIATILNTTLANNGGETLTHLLASGSVASNAGNNSNALKPDGSALTRDQRGNPRRIGAVDIGAVELFVTSGPILVDNSSSVFNDNFDPGDVSLWEAIVFANASPGPDTINFASALNGQTITLADANNTIYINDTLTIAGNGATSTIIDLNQSNLYLTVGNLLVDSLTMRDGNSAIETNTGTALLINRSYFTENTSTTKGGAVHARGPVSILESTFADNGSGVNGGAVFASGPLTASQSTFSGNVAGNSSSGGAIYATALVTIQQSTIANNTASVSGSGVYSALSPTIRNSIVAGNTGPNQLFSGVGTSNVSNSLIGNASGNGLTATQGTTPDANGNFVGSSSVPLDPKLLPLANNGGPTLTHAIQADSLALNTGSNANAVDITNGNTPLTADQRGIGFNRIMFETVDIGAFESQTADLIHGTSDSDAFVVTYTGSLPTGTVSVTVSNNGGPVRNLGTFSMSTPLTVSGFGGTDSIRVVGTNIADTMTVASSTQLNINGALLTTSSIENRTLAGRGGNDIYRFDTDVGLGTFALEEFGNGTDTIDFSLTTTQRIEVNLATPTLQVINNRLSLILGSGTAFENVNGGDKNDTLSGNSRNNILRGNAGDDFLEGLAGNDLLFGGLGDDEYRFHPAETPEADSVTELANHGTDILYFGLITSGVSLNLGTTDVQNVHTNRTLKLNSSATFEDAVGGQQASILIGNSLDNLLQGFAIAGNILIGMNGNDILVGGNGRDFLVGGRGTDTLRGNGANDVLIAGRTTLSTDDLIDLHIRWVTAETYAGSVLLVTTGTPKFQAGVNVLNDEEVDQLYGVTGLDYFFASSADTLTDRDPINELLDLL
jgi:predicted outer membrane repeat protein